MALKRAVCFFVGVWTSLCALATDAACQLNILRHDGYTLCMDGTQVGVFEETDQVGFAGFLEGHDGRTLEAQFSLEILGDFTDETLEWQFTDKKLGALLVTTDLTESNCSWPVTMRLFHTAGCWCRFASCFGC